MKKQLLDMDLSFIKGEYKEKKLTYFQGFERTIYYTEIETPFPDGKLIVSTTDLEGRITHFNKSFLEMSGYSGDELMDQHHSILRHPDIPTVAFKDLWDTILNGKKWHGYVKNLRKDGGYYWVYATVVPNIRNGQIIGLTSVRRKPSRDKVEAAIELYKTLNGNG